MKTLPPYLESIIDFIAECEEKHGGMKKAEAEKLFTKELINESLTAKANPTLGNPRGRPKASLPTNEIVNHYENGASIEKIASIYDINTRTVKDRLTDAGIKIRGTGRVSNLRKENKMKKNPSGETTKEINIGKFKEMLFNEAVREVEIDNGHSMKKFNDSDWEEVIQRFRKKQDYRANPGRKYYETKPKLRDFIVRYIKEHPGITLKEFMSQTKLSFTHLEDLTHYGHIYEVNGRYYPISSWGIEGNPRRPAVSEMTSVFYKPFEQSPFGKSLSDQEKKEIWRDIELFSEKLITPLMAKLMGFRMKRGDSREPTDLEFDNRTDRVVSRKEQAERVEKNRYFKLFLTAYFMSLLERMFYVTKGRAENFLNASEGGKTWEELAQLSNREAHAEFVRTGMLALMDKVKVDNLARWASGSEGDKAYDEIYSRAKKLWDAKLKQQGEAGKAKLKQIQELVPGDMD